MLGVGALELFNEAKDSVAVTLRDLTHDAKRLAPFDVTQPPWAGVGGKDGGRCVCGVCVRDGAGVRWCGRSSVTLPRVPTRATNRRLIARR